MTPPDNRKGQGAAVDSEKPDGVASVASDITADTETPSVALRALLRRPPPPPPSDVLRGVQQKLRVRSEGKFYADGWSTREENPRSTYLITALIMLAILLLAYLMLRPNAVAPGPEVPTYAPGAPP